MNLHPANLVLRTVREIAQIIIDQSRDENDVILCTSIKVMIDNYFKLFEEGGGYDHTQKGSM